MRLSYRGTVYQSVDSAFESAHTQQVGQFLGNPFEIKRASVTQRPMASVQLKYRGVSYSA